MLVMVVIEVTGAILFVSFVVTQTIIPLARGSPLFPLFRKEKSKELHQEDREERHAIEPSQLEEWRQLEDKRMQNMRELAEKNKKNKEENNNENR